MLNVNCVYIEKSKRTGFLNKCSLKVGLFRTCDIIVDSSKTCFDAAPHKEPTDLPPPPTDARRTNYLYPAPPPRYNIKGKDIILPAWLCRPFMKKKKSAFRLDTNDLDNQEGIGPFTDEYIRKRRKSMLIAVAKDHNEAILDAVFTKSPELAKVYWHGKGVHPHTTVYYTTKDLEDHPTGVIPLLPKRVIALLHEVQ